MAAWKKLGCAADAAGEEVLLREGGPGCARPGYMVGIVADDALDGPCLKTAHGRVRLLPGEYSYYYVRLRDVAF